MNPGDWILEGRMASVVWKGHRIPVFVSHSRKISDFPPRREYHCHHHTSEGIETFEVGERDIRL